MKICVLHRYPMSLVRGTNPSFPLFIDKLLAMGHRVFFVSFKETEKNLYETKIHFKEISVHFDRANKVDKLIKSLIFVLVAPLLVTRLHKKEKFDVVYCDDSLPFYGFLIKKIVKTKTIARLGDLQSAYMFADGNFLQKLIFKFVLRVEKMMWRSVDKVIVISQAFKDFLISNGISRNQIDCVQECIDLEFFKPKSSNGTIRKWYGLGDSPLVMFHGLVERMKGLDTLVNAIPRVLGERPDTKFMIVGEGGDLKRVKKHAKKLGIEGSVIFTGWVNFKNIPNYIAECDVGIASRSGNLGNNFVVTTALLQYWAMEKPVVAPGLMAINNLFTQEQVGLIFEPDDSDDLAKKILEMLKATKETRRKIGARGRAIAKKIFDIEVASEKMVQILN